MNVAHMMELALGTFGLEAAAGVPPESPNAVQVVALCRHKVDGVLVHAGQHYWLPKERAELNAARDIVHIPDATRLDWWGAKGRVLSPFTGDADDVFARAETPGALKIAMGCGYDPGSAAYRTHSAINAATKHACTFTRFEDTNPHCSLRQLDGVKDAPLVRESLLTADVLHCHMNYMLAANSTSQLLRAGDPRSARPVHWRPGQWIVRHYHGSRPDGRTNLEHRVDELVRLRAETDGGGLIRVGARLTICAEPGAEDLEWLPITIPVARYRALRDEVGYEPYDGRRPFRVAHSPTKRSYKGTEKFVAAIDRLREKGLNVEAVMIENRSHADALRIKATADACFDSFWLGIQGSGLESGAMGMPVIAGDESVRDLYVKHVGECPYTFAHNAETLEREIEALATDEDYRALESLNVEAYVRKYHDYPAVARRYEEILAKHTGRADVITAMPVSEPVTAVTPGPATDSAIADVPVVQPPDARVDAPTARSTSRKRARATAPVDANR